MSKRPPKEPEHPGRFAYQGLDPLIHEKSRLSIVTSLAAHPEGLVFGDLKELCSLTDGNLSRHLLALNEGGLVEVLKGYKNNRPQTLCRLSDAGRRAPPNTLCRSSKPPAVTDASLAAPNAPPHRLEGFLLRPDAIYFPP